MPTVFLGQLEVCTWVPAAGQLFDRRHIDVSVVQVLVERWHVSVDEHAVGADAVAG